MALPPALVRPYVDILAFPGAWRFSLAAWFGRIMRSTAGIGAIFLIADRSSNYALAGAVSGCVVLGAAILSPSGPGWLTLEARARCCRSRSPPHWSLRRG